MQIEHFQLLLYKLFVIAIFNFPYNVFFYLVIKILRI